MPGLLRTAAAYAWRLIAVGVVARAVFSVLGEFHQIAVAVFLGLVITAVLRPVADLLARFVPRPLAVAAALVGCVVLILGVLTLVGESAAGQRSGLQKEFVTGVDRIERQLEAPPSGSPRTPSTTCGPASATSCPATGPPSSARRSAVRAGWWRC